MRFWIPWTLSALVSAVCVYFFLVGLADGSVSSFNGGLWLGLLLLCGGVTGGSFRLKQAGRPGAGALLALVLAVPGALFGLFVLMLLLTNPRWN
ncbi:MAG: hypothetical protein U0Q55_05155 [Vicinamibacterales bacterium]